MRSLLLGLAVVSVSALSFAVFPSLPMAQSGSSGGAAPVCLVKAASGDGDAVVVVTQSDVAGLEAKGFEAADCAEKFGSQTSLLSYRDAICTIASIPDKDTQDIYEAEFGERPAVLCGMAERALGQWKRKGEV